MSTLSSANPNRKSSFNGTSAFLIFPVCLKPKRFLNLHLPSPPGLKKKHRNIKSDSYLQQIFYKVQTSWFLLRLTSSSCLTSFGFWWPNWGRRPPQRPSNTGMNKPSHRWGLPVAPVEYIEGQNLSNEARSPVESIHSIHLNIYSETSREVPANANKYFQLDHNISSETSSAFPVSPDVFFQWN